MDFYPLHLAVQMALYNAVLMAWKEKVTRAGCTMPSRGRRGEDPRPLVAPKLPQQGRGSATRATTPSMPALASR